MTVTKVTRMNVPITAASMCVETASPIKVKSNVTMEIETTAMIARAHVQLRSVVTQSPNLLEKSVMMATKMTKIAAYRAVSSQTVVMRASFGTV